jgi:4-hydroxybenzoate 3-monooxygenase
MSTKVCIIGGGPSGLLLSQLLHLKGIDNVLLEKHSRDYVLSRIRAGVLEHGFAALMREAQCGERMDREGEIHRGFIIAHDGKQSHVDLHKYSGGNSVIVYGQTELTRDLYDAREKSGGKLVMEADDVQPHDLKTGAALCHLPQGWRRDGRIDCEYVIGADGFHGVSRKSIPADVLRGIREGLSLRLAGCALAHQAGVARADLRQARARLRPVLAAFAGAEPLLHPGAADRQGRRLVGRRLLGGTQAPPAGRGRRAH